MSAQIISLLATARTPRYQPLPTEPAQVIILPVAASEWGRLIMDGMSQLDAWEERMRDKFLSDNNQTIDLRSLTDRSRNI